MREQGRRARRGPFAIVFAAPSGAAPAASDARVGFAIGRRAGSAVVRNRIRRRARAALTALSSRPDTPLVPGAYLVSADARAADLPFREIEGLLEAAVRAATAPPPPGSASR